MKQVISVSNGRLGYMSTSRQLPGDPSPQDEKVFRVVLWRTLHQERDTM